MFIGVCCSKFSKLIKIINPKNIQRLIVIIIFLYTLKVLTHLLNTPESNKRFKGTEITSKELSEPLNFRRSNLNFNEIVLEEENVGIEEGEYLSQNPRRFKQELGKDQNAALEVLSHQQDHKEEVLSLTNINDAIASSKKNINLSLHAKTYVNFVKNMHHPLKLANKDFVWSKSELQETGYWNFRNFSNELVSKLSTLGRRLFLHEEVGVPLNREFLIYVYKFGERLKKRFMTHYGKKILDPFENCSVKNCIISINHSDFHQSDAVLFHLHLLKGPPTNLERKNFNQRWVWLSDESVFNTFMVAKDKNLDHYNNFFNWSMTYRSESDVPVPYGRTVPLLGSPSSTTNDLDVFSRKNKTVAIMGSNCGGRNGRWKYVKILGKYIEVDTYGGCGKIKCAGHFTKDCPLLNSYKFYLAFENANCKEYITEKAWWSAFEKESVPIVMGTSKTDYLKMFPPDSFIHVQDFNSPKDLAEYIKFLSQNRDAYNEYHLWRAKYQVLNEHGYFQTNVFHYCRLCEALNYNSPIAKNYNQMAAFWNISRDCNSDKFLPLPTN